MGTWFLGSLQEYDELLNALSITSNSHVRSTEPKIKYP